MESFERTRHGCHACRERHAKCDALTPTCRRCQKFGLECIRKNPIRFAPLQGVPLGSPHHASQQSTGEIIFIDESPRLVDLYKADREPSSSPCAPLNWGEERHTTPAIGPDPVTQIPGDCIISSSISSHHSQFIPDSPAAPVVPGLAPVSSPPPLWCLENESEIELLRHYVDVISVWLDICDVERTFGVLVPRLIPRFPPLLKAILAVSARHLGLMTGRNVLAADRYNQECLSGLIPVLNDESAVTDEVILAVIVILRLSEELEAPVVRADVPGHMLGIRHFVRAQGRLAHCSKLRQAALCIMVRQENYLALMNMCSIGWDLEEFKIPSNPEPTDEFGWSMFILRHCSNIIQLCHDESSREKRELWEEMKKTNIEWMLCKPSSFDPVLTMPADRNKGEPFPREWFVQGWHATSVQHYHLNMVLLSICNPHIPQFGVGHVEAKRKAEDDILMHMRHLCGIAVANSQIQPSLVTAYMSISMCGDRFMDRLDQEKMIELLVRVNKVSAWPTIKVQQQLRKAWGWE